MVADWHLATLSRGEAACQSISVPVGAKRRADDPYLETMAGERPDPCLHIHQIISSDEVTTDVVSWQAASNVPQDWNLEVVVWNMKI